MNRLWIGLWNTFRIILVIFPFYRRRFDESFERTLNLNQVLNMVIGCTSSTLWALVASKKEACYMLQIKVTQQNHLAFIEERLCTYSQWPKGEQFHNCFRAVWSKGLDNKSRKLVNSFSAIKPRRKLIPDYFLRDSLKSVLEHLHYLSIKTKCAYECLSCPYFVLTSIIEGLIFFFILLIFICLW